MPAIPLQSAPYDTAKALAQEFARNAVERDQQGGTPKAERDALRHSGLLGLSIPRGLGGLGGTWRETLDIVRLFAQVDSSLAHVFGFHHLMLATLQLFGQPTQWQPWFAQTAKRQWFWGNALNPLDERNVCTTRGTGKEFSGQKSFCSGAMDSEMLVASAREEQTGALVVAVIPTGRSGVSVFPDWNNIGQRQTDSGSVSFERVRVEQHEVLADPGPLTTPYACLRPLVAQLVLTHIYLGIAEGAFQDARHFTLHEARAWHGVQAAAQDPYVLAHYGQFWVGLQGVRLLATRAAELLDDALAVGPALSESQRGDVALASATAKVAATTTGLEICNRMFDVAGARATHGDLRLDRHWRNLRTHSLHDPVAYKIREIGDWALNQRYPVPSFYS